LQGGDALFYEQILISLLTPLCIPELLEEAAEPTEMIWMPRRVSITSLPFLQMLCANKPILSPNNERSLLSYLEICAAG